jgi:hypothetical protein
LSVTTTATTTIPTPCQSYKYNIRTLVMDWWNRGRVIEVRPGEFQPVFVGIATTGTTESALSHG